MLTNAGMDVRKGDPYSLLVGVQTHGDAKERNVEAPQRAEVPYHLARAFLE